MYPLNRPGKPLLVVLGNRFRSVLANWLAILLVKRSLVVLVKGGSGSGFSMLTNIGISTIGGIKISN